MQIRGPAAISREANFTLFVYLPHIIQRKMSLFLDELLALLTSGKTLPQPFVVYSYEYSARTVRLRLLVVPSRPLANSDKTVSQIALWKDHRGFNKFISEYYLQPE
jgi:hypothetical protein